MLTLQVFKNIQKTRVSMLVLDLKYPFYKIFCFFTLSIFLISCSSDSISEQNPFPKDDGEIPFSRLLINQKFYSTVLGEDLKYAVLLPEEYDKSKDDYPVVYLLHGFGNDEKAWYSDGMIQYYSDKYRGEITPMIFVMPSAYNTYYANRYNGSYPFMNMLTKEMVPEIDKLFRTKIDKKYRAAMGYSMGGYGALILPALNPEVFSVGVPLSMSFRTDEQYIAEPQNVFDVQWSPIFGGRGMSGVSRLTDYFKQYSPFHFFDTPNLNAFSGLKLLIDCGDDEETLSNTNDNLHALMRDNQISHEYRVRNGAHSFEYWKESLPEALKFISNAVQGIEHPSEPTPVTIGTRVESTDFESVDFFGVLSNILLPTDYANNTANYPVVYFIHDFEVDQRNKNVTDVFSLLRNAMIKGVIPKSIIVEIPASANLSSFRMTEIITKVDAGYRTKAIKESRIVLGNSLGGLNAASIASEDSNLFNSCFLFGAQLADKMESPAAGVFYYLDITDKGKYYRGYHNLYAKIRASQIKYEYRVRQGTESYQSFLNGLSNSLSILNKKLNLN